jgi:hypothetical protein
MFVRVSGSLQTADRMRLADRLFIPERPDRRCEKQAPERSPRELAVRFTDERRYFVSEASVYRLLKAHDLITSPALW